MADFKIGDKVYWVVTKRGKSYYTTRRLEGVITDIDDKGAWVKRGGKSTWVELKQLRGMDEESQVEEFVAAMVEAGREKSND